MSKDDTQHALVPKLRFPEFRDALAWNEDVLTGLCDVNPDYDGLPESFYYIDLESVQAGELRNLRRIDRESAPSRAQRYLSDGDILFQTVRPYQRNNLLFNFGGEDDYVASTGYAQLRARENVGFLYQLVHTDSFVDRVITKCTGSNYPAINSSDLALVSVWIPPDLAEQQKIAECLGSLDDLIAAEGRKLAGLREHKKGLMQQLFPREGETQPRLRFPEFRDAGDWDEQRLEQIADFQSGGTPSKGNSEFWNGSIPWVSAKDMKQLVLDDTGHCITDAAVEDGAKLVPAGTVLMLTRGMTLLKDVPICLLARPMSFNQDVRALRPKNGFDGRFLAYMLVGNKQRIRSMVDIAGHGTGRLNTDRIKALELLFPPPVEQQRIADCLSALDALIAAQAEKLDALRTHKRGLMQQLFPSPEDFNP